MTEDRGGLQYSIKVGTEGLGDVQTLKAEVQELKAALDSLRKAKGRTRSKEGEQATAREIENTSKATQTLRQRLTALRALTRQEQARAAGLASLDAEARKQEATDARAIASQRAKYRIEQRNISSTEARRRAEEKLTRTLDKRLAAEQAFRNAPGRGIRTDEEITRRQKAAQQIQQLEEQQNKQRITALRQDIQERLNAQVAAEKDLADKTQTAKERAAIANQKLLESQDQKRITALRENIQQRLDAEVKAEEELAKKISAARERAAVENQKKEREINKQRLATLKEGIQQRERDKVAAAKAQVAQAKASADERKARIQKLKDFFNLKNALDRTDTAANRVSFTFRRLFGILAAFTAARLLAQQFGNAVKEMVNFNRRLEIGQLGVAALILATGQVRDATGQVVDKTQQLAIAQKESRRQLDLLRRDSLKTAATFQELLEAFQVGLAPGLQAGLNLDQIRKFSIRISQAATALGLSQNQLSEEIRSILAGTIQQRTTRIAASLGITNEDIKKAKEAGKLVEFLDEKFSAFSVAGEEAFNTFEGVLGRVRDGISLLLGAGGLEFFESVKDLLKGIYNTIAQEDPISGIIEPRPEAVRAVKEIGDALSAGIKEARQFSNDFGGIEGIARAVGAALRFAFQTTRTFLTGFVQGFRLVINLGNQLLATLSKIPILSEIFKNADLQNTILFLGQISALLVGISIITAALKAPFALISLSLGAIKILLGPINVGIAAIALAWGGIARAIALAKAGMIVFSSAALSAQAPVAAILATVVAVVAALAVAVKQLNDISKLDSETSANKIIQEVQDRLLRERQAQIAFLKSLEESGTATEKQLTSVRDALKNIDEQLKELQRQSFGNVGGKGFLDPLLDDLRETTSEVTQSIAAQIKELTRSLLPEITQQIEPSIDASQKLSAIFKELPGQIDRSRTELDRQADTIQKLTEDTEAASDALQETLAVRKLSGSTEQQISAILAAEVRLRKEGKALALEEQDIAQRNLGVAAQRARLDAATAKLSEEDQKRVRDGVHLGKVVLSYQKDIADLSKTIAINRQRIAAATGEEKAAIEKVVAEDIEHLGWLQRVLDARLAQADIITGDRDNQEALNTIIAGRISLEGQEVVLRDRAKAIAKDQLELENRISNIRSLNIRKLSEANRLALTEETTKLDADRARKIAEINAQQLQVTQRRILLARVESEIADRDLRIMQEQFALQEKSLDAVKQQTQQALVRAIAERQTVTAKEDIERVDAQIQNHADTIASLEAERAILGERNRQALALQNAEATELNRILQEAKDAAERPVELGFSLGLREFVTQAPDLFQAVFNAARQGAEQFSQFLADSITSAFDPTQNTSLRERFGQFLLGAANQFLSQVLQDMIANFIISAGFVQTPLQLASASLLTAAGPLATAGTILDTAASKLILAATLLSGTRGIGLGFASGGSVGEAFKKARGYAGGGVPNRPAPASLRPAGLDPKDTVAAWLDPREWVIRGRSVAAYGAEVMDKINRGLIDPTSLRALAGVSRGRSAGKFKARGRGLAAGGSAGSVPANTRGNFVPAVIAPSEETYRRLVRGGARAFMEEAQRQGLVGR